MVRHGNQRALQGARQTSKDLVKYADIAFDVEVYGFAATIYWNVVLAIGAKNTAGGQERCSSISFARSSLGITGLKRISMAITRRHSPRSVDRRKLMEENPATKVFAKDKGTRQEVSSDRAAGRAKSGADDRRSGSTSLVLFDGALSSEPFATDRRCATLFPCGAGNENLASLVRRAPAEPAPDRLHHNGGTRRFSDVRRSLDEIHKK